MPKRAKTAPETIQKGEGKGRVATPKAKTLYGAPVGSYAMPTEVKDWIERAHATIQHLRGELERVKVENQELRAYRKWAEARILRSQHE
jgi:hypothetical protein